MLMHSYYFKSTTLPQSSKVLYMIDYMCEYMALAKVLDEKNIKPE